MKLKACPICGDEYIHRREVLYIPDTDQGGGVPVSLFSIRGLGEAKITVGTEPVRALFRGSELRQSFECEMGRHVWVEVSSFHKGNIHEKIMFLPPLRGDDEYLENRRIAPFECMKGGLENER